MCCIQIPLFLNGSKSSTAINFVIHINFKPRTYTVEQLRYTTYDASELWDTERRVKKSVSPSNSEVPGCCMGWSLVFSVPGCSVGLSLVFSVPQGRCCENRDCLEIGYEGIFFRFVQICKS